MVEQIPVEIETITPMFLAGADQAKAELRGPSIKGLLRYWWRALQKEPDIEVLRDRENRIFGSADQTSGGGSSFSIRIASDSQLIIKQGNLPRHTIEVNSKSLGRTISVNILEYLAYGTVKSKDGIPREYLDHASRFNLVMTFFRDDSVFDVLKAFYALAFFGGIGSRSRNGFGSFVVLDNEAVFGRIASEFPSDGPYTKTTMTRFLNISEPMSYSSFSKGTRLFRSKTSYDTWDKALAAVGMIYRGIRSGDIKGGLSGKEVFERHFAWDKRKFIGAPLMANRENRAFLERRAKPYFVKIGKLGNRYQPYVLYLPSQYSKGLNEDRFGGELRHSEVNKQFQTICSEFNGFLSQTMDSIV
jgi:CRISPR-associated protein Cmr1